MLAAERLHVLSRQGPGPDPPELLLCKSVQITSVDHPDNPLLLRLPPYLALSLSHPLQKASQRGDLVRGGFQPSDGV